MSTPTFSELVALAGSLATGELVDKARVIDALLDLRNAAPTASIVEVVDHLLTTAPGRTMVLANWWLGALDELSLAADLELTPEPVV
jgi:hypothetical protein